MPVQQSDPRVLLVEGVNDKHVVLHLAKIHLPDLEFTVIEKGGFESLIRSFYPEAMVHGRIAVGIMADANDNPCSRWRSISGVLARINLAPLGDMTAQGTIIEGEPRVGIWLMPDNRSKGELEDFVATLIPDDDPVWPLACCYIDSIDTKDRKFSQNKHLRASIHAWLAARQNPKLIGSAIASRDLNANAPSALRLVQWLHTLFR